MKNTGVLISNDSNKERIKALKGNLHRLGVTNCMLTNYDARKFPKFISGFDRILLDAPCSGLGVIFKDPSVKLNRTVADIKKNSHLQKELILAAIDCLNAKSSTGGFLVYSTCSVSVEENEEVVQYALTNRNVKLVETGLEVGEPGFPKFRGKIFDPKMIRCKRVYPHTHNMDGFFVAKLKKFENDLPEGASKPHTGEKRPKLKKKKQAEEAKQETTQGDEEVKLPKKRSREAEITEQAEPTPKEDRKRPKVAREDPADHDLKTASKKRKASHREEVEEPQPAVPKSTRRSRREEAEARAKARKKHR
jgi:ribosomal RNA methyltransferase Nop2